MSGRVSSEPPANKRNGKNRAAREKAKMKKRKKEENQVWGLGTTGKLTELQIRQEQGRDISFGNERKGMSQRPSDLPRARGRGRHASARRHREASERGPCPERHEPRNSRGETEGLTSPVSTGRTDFTVKNTPTATTPGQAFCGGFQQTFED